MAVKTMTMLRRSLLANIYPATSIHPYEVKNTSSGLAGNDGFDLAPVTLELLAGVGLEADGRTARAQGTLGGDVVAQDGDAAVIALALELAEDDNRVPNAVLEQAVDGGLEGGELATTSRVLGSGSGPPRLSARLTVLGWTLSSAAMSF